MSHILDQIETPADIRRLSIAELRRLAGEIRQLIVETVARTGGHLAPSLGVVELTLALHYVFNTPQDQIIWDVGHQCYAHKIITGRARGFARLRQSGGLSGFPKRSESPYDAFDTGHAGDSISVALGLACADRLAGRERKVIAVTGDGSIVTGIAFEGLNNAGGLQQNVIVVLNDNEMSIARTTGGFARYLNRIITGRSYNLLRNDVWNLLGRLPANLSGRARLAARKLEEGLKNLVAPSLIFEELGFRYFGPFDGHNLITLIDCLRKVKELSQPLLVHVVTKKGKGYPPAEQRPEVFHGVGRFDAATGAVAPGPETTFTRTFGATLVRLAAEDPRIVAVTAGMSLGTGLAEFRARYPDRFFDTGITEQHAVAFAAGLALAGLRPVVAIYSTFLARAYDQIIQDVCLQGLPVVFAVDRSGLVGEDGPTHHGTFDLSYLRCLPNLTVAAPADETELEAMLEFALQPRSNPIALRYPRGSSYSGSGLRLPDSRPAIEEGRGWVIHGETNVMLIAIGSMVLPALAVAELLRQKGIAVGVANLRFAKPLDSGLLARCAHMARLIITLEENTCLGGIGEAITRQLASLGYPGRTLTIGIRDEFVTQAPRPDLLELAGLDPNSIARQIRQELTS